MTKKNKIALGFILLSFFLLGWWFFSSDTKSKFDVDLSDVEKSIEIYHFDDAFFTSDIQNFNDEFQLLKKKFNPFFQSNNDINFWLNQRQDKGQNQLYADWKNQLKNYKKFDDKLSLTFKHLYHYYPMLPEFEVYTYISNLDINNPIIVAENYVFIAVDLYEGAKHPAYQNEPDYLNYFRQKEFIGRDVTEAVAENIVAKTSDEQTLIDQMIYWGKMRYFNKAMNPETHDTIVQKMSSKKLAFCLTNEENMWTYFIKNQLLYDASLDTERRFIQPAPFSKFGMPFDAETPGMVGRWIGFRIVESYMNHNPEVTLQKLMAQTDTRLIFKNSKYKP